MNAKEEKRSSIERAVPYHITIRNTNNELNDRKPNPYCANLARQAQAALVSLQKELRVLAPERREP